ncbi:hypothetical protein CIHG_07925 [Coccidioides immitis H538.4]|uniref:Secreted protein n=3 Tax=Coccidioides immitis TaxID=5501 RepID=A0A0J8R6J0_COCIT|nr:hypothetical protein CIRG_10135 [Coccidioides immitis RMSCC 2394]KMU79353.1 hypothetical protein CISG_07757 [Coccidioides immitis RMSCC 3703]KMU90115.1 hypothetical protein CIHG_07925 [Coccidioides immitis H538.4]
MAPTILIRLFPALLFPPFPVNAGYTNSQGENDIHNQRLGLVQGMNGRLRSHFRSRWLAAFVPDENRAHSFPGRSSRVSKSKGANGQIHKEGKKVLESIMKHSSHPLCVFPLRSHSDHMSKPILAGT